MADLVAGWVHLTRRHSAARRTVRARVMLAVVPIHLLPPVPKQRHLRGWMIRRLLRRNRPLLRHRLLRLLPPPQLNQRPPLRESPLQQCPQPMRYLSRSDLHPLMREPRREWPKTASEFASNTS